MTPELEVERLGMADLGRVPSRLSLVDDSSLVDRSLVETSSKGRSLLGMTSQALRSWDTDFGFARFVLTCAGLELEELGVQPWKLGAETHSVVVERARDGCFRLRVDEHRVPAPLAVVYAATVASHYQPLGRAEFPCWKRRALLEAGSISLPAVTLAPLPEEATEETSELWTAIALLLRVRGEPATEPLPLTRRFLRRWVPQSEWVVRQGMEYLEKKRLVWRVANYLRPGGVRPTTLWRVELERPSDARSRSNTRAIRRVDARAGGGS